MTDDQTEYQTAAGKSTSQTLSMQATTPPSEVPGYQLSQFLGAGAFGQVWVGRDLNTGRDVAVKFYLHRGGVNWSLLSREVKNLVQLSADRQVVQVLEVGWDADPPYYVMELVTGGSLEDFLKSRPSLPVSEAIEMFRKICVGLSHCHAKGVLHCDLKPANVLIGEEDEPRLADFGQSRLSHEQTPALGTLFYMAPEQADLNSAPDASWDVYAAGAILYRMLTGTAPHRDDTVIQKIDTEGSLPKRLQRYRETIQQNPPPDRHLQVHGVDRALAKIVSKCLAADPGQRYKNVQQILHDLKQRDRARTRWPLLLLGIVGPLLVLMTMSFFGYRSIKQASQRTKEALRTEAFSSNKLAATFAARTLESEIQRYFDLTNDEAEQATFSKQLKETLADPEVTSLLKQIANLQTPAATHGQNLPRLELLKSPSVIKLTRVLQNRLKRYSRRGGPSRRPRLASMFVTDSVGTILSIAYDTPVAPDKVSAGKNFSYRTYFHGAREDLPREHVTIGETQPLTQTRLSAAFPSTATRLWKVAVSTPIHWGEDRRHPDAIFVVTINLGDFELLQSEQGANQVAVLVEAREGVDRGLILQHPLYDQRRAHDIQVKDQSYQIESDLMNRLLAGEENIDYLDPLAEVEDGREYQGPWIAAMQPVALPSLGKEVLSDDAMGDETTASDESAEPSENTDLLVLVQYRLETVMAPVTQMRKALLAEGAAALASILIVTLVLWYFVRKVDQVKPFTPANASGTSNDLMKTIAAK